MNELLLAESWCIVLLSTEPAAELAASELRDVLHTISGVRLPVLRQPPAAGSAFVLSHEDGQADGFRWQASSDRVDVRGHSPRGLLYAVYSFLEALGCRWVSPGKDGERLPQDTRFTLPDGPVAETPALPGRCLIVGHHVFMQDIEGWIVWAARNRLNTIFAHVIEGPRAFGAAPESEWQAHKEAAVALSRQRGMVIEHGGHGLPNLLPRKLFRQMPEAFRYQAGQRVQTHNFCPSCEEGLEIVRQNARAYFVAHPEVDVFHLWPDDFCGGWCACDRCHDYTPSEQSLVAINAVAEVLEEVNPRAQIAYIAYLNTEAVPTRVTPRPNACLLWAPRSRCYAHATDDEACPVNVPHYAAGFRAQVAHFAEAQPARVFEYYLDAVLFKSLLPPLPTVMQRDLRFYRDAGAHTVQALMTGDRPWITPQINAWLFARQSWDPDQDVDALVADFCRATFGTDSPTMPAYYRTLESAFALALDLVPEQVVLPEGFGVKEMFDSPIADMGDPACAPPDVLHKKREANAEIEDLLRQAAHHLEEARPTAISSAWTAERAAFDLIRAWLRFDLARVRLYDAVSAVPIAPEARRWYDEARAALHEAFDWGERHVSDPRVRKNFFLTRYLWWQLRLDTIAREYFTPAWLRWARKLGGLIRIAWRSLSVRDLYGG